MLSQTVPRTHPPSPSPDQWPALAAKLHAFALGIPSYDWQCRPGGDVVYLPYPLIHETLVTPNLVRDYMRSFQFSVHCFHNVHVRVVNHDGHVTLECPLTGNPCPFKVDMNRARLSVTDSAEYTPRHYLMHVESNSRRRTKEELCSTEKLCLSKDGKWVEVDMAEEDMEDDADSLHAEAHEKQLRAILWIPTSKHEDWVDTDSGDDDILDSDSEGDPPAAHTLSSCAPYVCVRVPYVASDNRIPPPQHTGRRSWCLWGDGAEHTIFERLFVKCQRCSLVLFGDSYPTHPCSEGVKSPKADEAEDGATPSYFAMWAYGVEEKICHTFFVRCTTCLLYLVRESYTVHKCFLLHALGLTPSQARGMGYALIAAADAVERMSSHSHSSSTPPPQRLRTLLIGRERLRMELERLWDEGDRRASSPDETSSSDSDSFVSAPTSCPTTRTGATASDGLESTTSRGRYPHTSPPTHSLPSERPGRSANHRPLRDNRTTNPPNPQDARNAATSNRRTPRHPSPTRTPPSAQLLPSERRGSSGSHGPLLHNRTVIPPIPRNARIVPRGFRYASPSLDTTGTVYVVTRGVQVGVFADWTEAGPLVTNISGSLHKGVKGVAFAQELLDLAIQEQWACWL
ncbi:hypothetical protein ONZ45_g9479 [Pleurotus djamor]|nr:hypothetical protein ONZ45_g9479 [Pleurotus djamor]